MKYLRKLIAACALLAMLCPALAEETTLPAQRITKTDLYLAGLSGTADCEARRKRLMHRLHLPEKLGANAFLEALNLLMTREEFLKQYGANDD